MDLLLDMIRIDPLRRPAVRKPGRKDETRRKTTRKSWKWKLSHGLSLGATFPHKNMKKGGVFWLFDEDMNVKGMQKKGIIT